MALQTTAFERAAALNWNIPELARRSGLSKETLYKVKAGDRRIGADFIQGILRAFPSLSYGDLFVSAISPTGHGERTEVHALRPAEPASKGLAA